MAQPFFSVIIPAYNAENSISICLKSMEEQAFSDIEVIVVDDGSQDYTAEKAEAFQKCFRELQIIRSANRGPAEARNLGIDCAKGKYLLFLDSDDKWLPDSLQKIATHLEEDSPDMLIFGFEMVMKETDTTFHGYCAPEKVSTASPEQLEIGRYYSRNILNQVWNKAYRSDFIRENHIRFQNYRYGEDRLFVLDCLRTAHTVSVVPYEYYSYIISNKESLIHAYHPDKFEVCCKIQKEISQLCQNKSAEECEIINYMFLKSVFSCLCDICGKRVNLKYEVRRNQVHAILNNELVKQALASYHCPNIVFRLLCCVIRTQNVTVNMAMAKCAAVAMNQFPNLTVRLKHQK